MQNSKGKHRTKLYTSTYNEVYLFNFKNRTILEELLQLLILSTSKSAAKIK